VRVDWSAANSIFSSSDKRPRLSRGILSGHALVRIQVEEPKQADEIKALQRCKAFLPA